MKINIMTLFPGSFSDFLRESIIGRAINNGLLEVNLYNIRDYSKHKSKSVDDYVYGGGSGMVIEAPSIYECYKDVVKDKKEIKTYCLSPRGKVFNQKMAFEMSKYQEINFLCGHYEGIDERALELIGAEELSIGDYILTGGELPCMVVIDSVARYIKGVLGSEESVKDESFSDYLLEQPQYTRPVEYEGLKVPDILVSGDHKKVDEWRLEKKIEITKKNRPDMYNKYLER